MKHVKKTATMKKVSSVILVLVAILLLFSCRKTPADLPGQSNPVATTLNQSTAAQAQGSVETVPYERIVFVPCANNGIGEEVQLIGTAINVDRIIYNNHGFTLTYHTNPKGVTGIGLSTGDKYAASGGTQETITGAFENNQFTGGYIEQLRIVGQGSTFIVSYRFHVTVTADGTFTSSISDDKVICR